MNAVVTMQTRVEVYLAERRRLGYHLRSTALALRSFARYVDGLDLSAPLSVEVMAAWARQAKTNSDNPTTWARRLKQLRPFARWLQQFDPATEVPDSTVFGRIGWRPARISSPSRRSAICWPPRGVLSPTCAGPPTRPSSACWRQRACASPRRCTCGRRTSICRRAC